MQQAYKFVCLLLFFISGYRTQDSPTTTSSPSDWHGDPKICLVNNPTTPSPGPSPSLPQFPNQAEFTIEHVIIRHRSTTTSPSELTLSHYIYDYENNKLTLIEDKNGAFDTQYYDYRTLTKSTYNYRENSCAADEIDRDIDMSRFRVRFPLSIFPH